MNLKDDSPILSRLVRNSFEHIDDRIDTWCVSEDNRGIVVRQVFGPQSAVTISKEHRTNKMRQYDPTTLEVGFFDDYINLQELANEMSRINEMAGEILS